MRAKKNSILRIIVGEYLFLSIKQIFVHTVAVRLVGWSRRQIESLRSKGHGDSIFAVCC